MKISYFRHHVYDAKPVTYMCYVNNFGLKKKQLKKTGKIYRKLLAKKFCDLEGKIEEIKYITETTPTLEGNLSAGGRLCSACRKMDIFPGQNQLRLNYRA